MTTIRFSRAWCDDHMKDCFFSYNETTGEHKHVDSYTEASADLIAHGFYYAGHRAGVFTYCQRKSAPLALDFQMLIDQHEAESEADNEPLF